MNMDAREFALAQQALLERQAGLAWRVQHPDQTNKQPVIWRCPNPMCAEQSTDSWYEFTSDYPECPKCGLTAPAVSKRALIHFLAMDMQGPIVGQMGLRYVLACSPTRVVLATFTNGEAATNYPSQVNCPGCLASAVYQAKLIHGVAMYLQP